MSSGGQGATAAAGGLIAPPARHWDAPFAVGDEETSTWGRFLSDVEAVGTLLEGASGEVVVACGDRYVGAVALAAVWQSGRVAALPPNGRPETIDALAEARGISLILHDGGGAASRARDVRPLLSRGDAGAPLLPLPAGRTIACVYTSGSTGASVACPKTAGQLLGEAALLARTFEVGAGARVLATVPSLHIYGLLFGTLMPLMGGGVIVRATPLHAETIAAVARAHGADVLCSVPAHLRGLAELAPGALAPLRRVFSSAAPLEAETAKRLASVFGFGVTEILGSTETGGIAWRDGTVGTAWRPLPGVEVTADTDGAMLVRSPFLPSGDDAGPYRGADAVRALPDGRFELVGRADGILKIGGTRVSVAEIERRLRAVPGVSDAAVVAVDVGGARGHELWAAVAPATLDPIALRAELRRHVDAVAVPRRFRAVATLPREDNGKLTRERLLALFPLARAAEGDVRYTHPFAIPADWKFFQGHFEGFPLVAGVVQMTEIVLPGVAARWPHLRHPRRVTNLKFRSPINPGDGISVELTLLAPLKVGFTLRRRDDVMSSGALEFAPESA
jgi:acyl-coenzyme A synthetase/AMP-(fatty) acid ligase